MAFVLFTLAKETGWSLDYLLWELPISVLNQGIHNFLHSKGAKLKRPMLLDGEDRLELAKVMGVEF